MDERKFKIRLLAEKAVILSDEKRYITNHFRDIIKDLDNRRLLIIKELDGLKAEDSLEANKVEVADNGWWKCPRCDELNWVLDKDQEIANCNRCSGTEFLLVRI